MATDREIVRRAVTDAMPLFVPVVPFGLVFGLAVTESSINHVVGWSSSWLIFAGAAQLTLVSLLESGTAAGAAIMAAVVVNARHLMYSAGLAPTFKKQPTWFRWLAPYVLVDQVFAQASLHLHDPPRDFRVYYLALGSVFWVGWQTTTAAGLFIGPILPPQLDLGFAVPILFVGILVMGIGSGPQLVAAVAGAAVTWQTAGLPNRSGLLVGAVAGILAGTIAERLRR